MNKLYFLIICVSLLFTNCEEVTVVNPELTYKEYIVVRAELRPFTNFDGVNITKTLPTDEPYDTNKAFLKNVIAYIKIDGIRIIPLHYYQNGLYKPYGNISPASGETFELYASVDGVTFYASTKIPKHPEVTSSAYTNGHLNALVKSNPNEVYGAVWAIVNPYNSSVIDMANDFLSVVDSTQATSFSTVSVSTTNIPDKYTSDIYKDYRCVKVYAFDAPYQRYFNTKNNNQPVSNAFVQGGDQIVWNVQGENAIGLFIGVAEGSFVNSN
jgi:hypothetical protein